MFTLSRKVNLGIKTKHVKIRNGATTGDNSNTVSLTSLNPTLFIEVFILRKVMYSCVRGVDFDSFYDFVYWILDML